MQKDINLITVAEESTTEVASRARRTRTSIFIILIFILIVGTIFGFSYYIKTELDTVSQKALAKEKDVEALKDVEEKYEIKKDKTRAIDEILTKRPDLVPVLDLLEKATPDGISYENIVIPSFDKISVRGSAKSSAVLGIFFSTLTENENFTKYIESVTMNSVALTKEGYLFDLLLVLTTNNKK